MGLEAQTSQTANEQATSLLVLDEPPKVTGVQVRVLATPLSSEARTIGFGASMHPRRLSPVFAREISIRAVTMRPSTCGT
jgi:hypothetical protein